MVAGVKRIIVVVVVALAVSAVQAQDRTVAKVNDTVLTWSDLNEVIDELIPATRFHRTVSPGKKASYVSQALELLIEKELIYHEAKARGMKVDKKLIEDKKAVLINKLGGKSAFKKALKQWGIKEKDYDRKLERSILIDDLRRMEIDDRSVVTEEEVKAYYEKNKAMYLRPEARRIRHILVQVSPSATPEEKEGKRLIAQEVYEKAKAGEDFAILAWNYSDDPYRVKSGDLGLIHSGRLDPDLDAVAFSLPVGQISNVVETIYGFHIMVVEEMKAEEQLSFENVSQRIEREMKETRLKKRKEAFIGALREKAKIEIYEQGNYEQGNR